LHRAGHDITTLQRSEAPGLPGRAFSGSINDAAAIAAACDGQDGVIHLAARVGVVGDWSDYERVNVDGTRALISTAQHAGVSRFVHVSSPSVAHAGEPLVGSGAAPADPHHTRGHYATSKAMAERAALRASTGAMPIVAIRPHLVWGPGDTQLVGRIIERARRGRLALVGSGAALIDTTYVTNAADALVAALDRAHDISGRALVVSNGEPRTVLELFTRITAAAGIDWMPRRVPAKLAITGGLAAERLWARTGRSDDPPMTSFLAEQLSTAHWFDQRATRQLLEWSPAVTLDAGFAALAASFDVG
jgi:nucleoside-diphosphate-sugar epimerase